MESERHEIDFRANSISYGSVKDRDNASRRNAFLKARLLKALFPKNRVELRQSASGRGFHIIVYGLKKSFNEIMQWRRWFGDDPIRMYYDAKRRKQGVPTQVLFTIKRDKRAERLVVY